MANILWEIQKTRLEHMRKSIDTPREIVMSRKAYDALAMDLEAAGYVYMTAETRPDGVIVARGEEICGMEITVLDDTGSGFIVVGGTARKIGKGQEGQENV